MEGKKHELFTAAPDRYGLLKAYATVNREKATDAELLLWEYLRGNALGVKFRRQHVIGDYIADFFCFKKKLIIEVDGGYHNDPVQREDDRIRSKRLNSMDYYVMRFTNDEVLNHTDYVLEKIKDIINKIE